MSDNSRAPGPPNPAARVRPVPTGRAPGGVLPLIIPPTANPIAATAQPPPPASSAIPETPYLFPPSAAPSTSRTSVGRPADVRGTSTASAAPVSPASSVGGEPQTPLLSGRPVDVRGTSTASVALISPASSVGEAAPNAMVSGRPADVQLIAPNHASTAARTTHALTRSRKPKPKAELDDERGRYRHTLRLTPQNEQKLQDIAESLGGMELNAAIVVCITTYHQSLAKRSKVDG